MRLGPSFLSDILEDDWNLQLPEDPLLARGPAEKSGPQKLSYRSVINAFPLVFLNWNFLPFDVITSSIEPTAKAIDSLRFFFKFLGKCFSVEYLVFSTVEKKLDFRAKL